MNINPAMLHPNDYFGDQPDKEEPISCEEPINDWFELTYAQYLTIPRSILEAMPIAWQKRMVECLRELDATFDWRPEEGRYWVELRTENERYARDPLREYRHPDTGYIESLRRTEPKPDA